MPETAATPLVATARVGLFGGAFDPPHCAHRALAEAAIMSLRLDTLHILPTGQAWHKSRALSDAVHRLAMCRLAFADLPGVFVDDREIRRPTATYTVDTLEELRDEQPAAHLFLLIGEDQLVAFRSWRRWRDILSMATLVVAARPDSKGASRLETGSSPTHEFDLPHERLSLPLWPVSSTAIRAMAAAGPAHADQMAALVPGPVAGYISHHSLYQQPS